MKLKSIHINSFRSIEDIHFDIIRLEDNSYTYGLIGVNEVGKSSILKAISLKGSVVKPIVKDFVDENTIRIDYQYEVDENEIEEFKNILRTQTPEINLDSVKFNDLILGIYFDKSNPEQQSISLEISSIEGVDEKEKILEQLKQLIYDKSHKPIFWTSEDRFLISRPINLTEFESDPDNISIPLRNCFALAGIIGSESIKKQISLISDSTERELLKDTLGEKVTEHINNAWPKHKIKITFDISDGLLNFHVRDLNSKGKAKTADQRSDGFKQFVSFLLTVSAQNKNNELTNSLLILDEPETHLHPQAQEDLLLELIKITQNDMNNVAIFATHSNYMIDKNDLSRNYKITKDINGTEMARFDKKLSTYSSVTYEVFDIPTTDYHSELYSALHQKYIEEDENNKERLHILDFDTNYLRIINGLKKDNLWKSKKNGATLPTYIRNCIDHPDNGNKYSIDQLRKSIEMMKTFK